MPTRRAPAQRDIQPVTAREIRIRRCSGKSSTMHVCLPNQVQLHSCERSTAPSRRRLNARNLPGDLVETARGRLRSEDSAVRSALRAMAALGRLVASSPAPVVGRKAPLAPPKFATAFHIRDMVTGNSHPHNGAPSVRTCSATPGSSRKDAPLGSPVPAKGRNSLFRQAVLAPTAGGEAAVGAGSPGARQAFNASKLASTVSLRFEAKNASSPGHTSIALSRTGSWPLV